MIKVQESALTFLKELTDNNNRQWFNKNKPHFDVEFSLVKDVFSHVLQNLEKHDAIEKQKIYRIYRDIRFSKDKTPYKTRFATNFSRLGLDLRGTYKLEIAPNSSYVAGGFWGPEKDDLYRIRKEFEFDDSEIREILKSEDFKNYFGGVLYGEELKVSPKGFDKTHSAIDLIRKKGFLAIRNFSDEQVLSPGFIDEVDNTFRALRSYFDLMSSILTTNLNGESLI